MNLTESLLTKWIPSSACDIDVRSVALSPKQWVKLLLAICRAPADAVKSLQLHVPHESKELRSVALAAVQSVVAHASHLQCLGLYMFLTDHDVCNIRQLLTALPAGLIDLHLRISTCGMSLITVGGRKAALFKAVAQMRSLRKLHMSQWNKLVGDHAEACTQPLRWLPGLKIVAPSLGTSHGIGVAALLPGWSRIPGFRNR